VIAVKTREEVNSGYNNIWTIVTFELIDVLKGPHVGSEIELGFRGATVGEITDKIGAIHVPKLGGTGIYFVESLSNKQVHPLLGWS